jgi:cellobiose phosphorylase
MGEGRGEGGEPLQFFNGYGGFTEDGAEYVIRLMPDDSGNLRWPPMPWINVIANENFGFLVSESGAGYTWSCNSRQHRLTPWYNDPISDPHSEALYIRDEETGMFWSPLPGHAPTPSPPLLDKGRAGEGYEARHEFGYSRFRHVSHGLEQEVCLFVPRRDPVKITRLRLTNHSGQLRRLSLFIYQRLVLGVLPQDAKSVVTQYNAQTNALLAHNPSAGVFSDGVAFSAVATPAAVGSLHYTADRAAFLGRYGSPERPTALLNGAVLDGATGAELDPCLTWQVTVSIAAGETLECAFLFGEATSRAEVQTLVERYRQPGAIAAALDEVRAFWKETVSAVQVETPVPAINLMVNGWLLYQILSCRLWGRSAFYQSGGAFGFRDQLQDSAALVYTRPDLTRGQILLHAAHQFVEGDVLHWWHPPNSVGIRTRFSDDLLWLSYLTAFYLQTTGDAGILDENVRFVSARPLAEGEDEAYLQPVDSGESANLYEHCCHALDRSLTQGAHGLPLMGTGDWNDGMNRVGRQGQGESVWLGFFLYAILGDFIPLCESRNDRDRAQRYRNYRDRLLAALNDAGWDGEWYHRAYYDDGAPLGSKLSDECQIDAIAQAWAVISKAAPAERAAQAMDAVERYLISEQDGIIRLLTPPFDKTPHDPGYIKGYAPGIRENGGQYTHAALWVVRALAELSRRDRAAKLLEMLSPITHARTPEEVAIYQVEPYVVAADIYGVSPHIGRGGWTWYTGSAGWMYRVALESILGFKLMGGDELMLKPCIPDEWNQFRLTYGLSDGRTRYEIIVRNPTGRAESVVAVIVDGQAGKVEYEWACIPLVKDGTMHEVSILLGKGSGGLSS